jgi:hypothetical protein
MDVQNIDVVSLKLLQGVSDREMQALLVISRVVDSLPFAKFPASVGGGEPDRFGTPC